MDLTEDTVTEVAQRLSGVYGPGGTDTVSLQHWILRFGGAMGELRMSVAEFAECILSENPPWNAYRTLICGQLIGLDTHPGVRTVGIEDNWRRLVNKYFLKVSEQGANEACDTD